jgi:hypothetical protein
MLHKKDGRRHFNSFAIFFMQHWGKIPFIDDIGELHVGYGGLGGDRHGPGSRGPEDIIRYD